MSQPGFGKSGREPTYDDVKSLLNPADDESILEILALRPSFAELEEAALWASGDGEAARRKSVSGVVGEILEILAIEEEEEPHSK